MGKASISLITSVFDIKVPVGLLALARKINRVFLVIDLSILSTDTVKTLWYFYFKTFFFSKVCLIYSQMSFVITDIYCIST